jgi:hypothetical protein
MSADMDPLLLPVTESDIKPDRLLHFHRALLRKLWVRNLDWDAVSPLAGEKLQLACSIASQSSHAEQIGLMTAAILLLESKDPVTRLSLSTAVQDEAVHTQVFAAYATSRGGTVSAPIEAHDKTKGYLTDPKLPFLERLFVHALAEGFATDQFYFLSRAFAGDLLGSIYTGVKSDEARHVRLGLDAMAVNISSLSEPCDLDVDDVGDKALYITGTDDNMFYWLSELTGDDDEAIKSRYMSAHRKRIRKVQQMVLAHNGGMHHA